MVKRVVVDAVSTFDAFAVHKGKRLPERHFNVIVSEDADILGRESDGRIILLARFRKSVFPPELQQTARDCFEEEARIMRKPRKAMPGSSRVGTRQSLLAGYWDIRDLTITKRMKKEFDMETLPGIICRTSKFTRDHIEEWKAGLPWIQTIASLQRLLVPDEYREQHALAKQVSDRFIIPKTPYSTVTVNYNWPTPVHVDEGDYGFGNLSVVGNEKWSGCYFGFPRFRVAINMRPGDFAATEVHEWHCNTPLKLERGGVRLAFICYLRKRMSECERMLRFSNGDEVGISKINSK